MKKLFSQFRYLLIASVVVFATACNADALISVDVEADGSGIVSLDVFLSGEDLDRLFDLDDGFSASVEDLQVSGWEVFPAEVVESGRRVSVRKAFGNPEQFSEVMSELSGSEGIFTEFALDRRQSFGNLSYQLSGVVDPSAGLDSFSDSALNEALGSSLSEFATGNEVSAADIDLEVVFRLPGTIEDGSSLLVAESSSQALVEGERRFQVDLEAGESGVVDLASNEVSISAQVLRGVAVLSGIAAGLVLLSLLLRFISGRAKPKPKVKLKRPEIAEHEWPVTSGPSEEDVEDEETEDEGVQRPHDVVVFDGMGVIYSEPENVVNLLVPFVRNHGCHMTDDEVLKKAKGLTLGRKTAAEFWDSVGLDDDETDLTEEYLGSLSLTPGIVKYILGLREQGIKIGCLTNDALEWSEILRRRHSLIDLIDIWVVSGEIGIRKPSHGAFEAVRRKAGVDSKRILLIDDELEVLDQASDFGFATALYADDELPEDSPHVRFGGFPTEDAL